MPKKRISVIYEKIDGNIVPQKYVIYFGAERINWEEHKRMYFSIEAPFQLHDEEDFYSETVSMSISYDELLRHPEKLNSFGINLELVHKRIKGYGYPPEEIEQFILLIADLEEIMQMTYVKERFISSTGVPTDDL
ncbi:hypothetical protein [Brevibacillus daliensis]|uniref:hypothetical protein n=1 Tax=Brevibacillus daliensis TaxID=2892995 RepID=UPI001E3C18F6|nr:hypothetical protein [Brevibacillus daliensis]